MSARRINARGKPTILIDLGHDEPFVRSAKLVALMRIPFDQLTSDPRPSPRRDHVAA